MEQQILIARCKKGDRAALQELYNKYCDAMYSTALRIVQREELACDVLQDSFLAVFQNIGQFKQESTVGAWIKRIVINHSFKLVKKELKYVELDEGIEMEDDFSEDNEEEVLRAIKQSIKDLPSGARTVFSLFYLEGLDVEEISQVCSVSRSTVKSQLHYARKLIRESLTKSEIG